MRFSSILTAFVVALSADVAVGSTWFGKAAYNKWHETELERWLSDNNVPYPTPADRKDLENLVKDNWNSNVATPYNSWDVSQLTSYLSSKGYQAKKGSEKNKDSLIKQVKSYWTETEDQASDSYSSVSSWILDSWSDSQIKAFCDRNSIPVPQPRNRDSLLKSARENYQSAATKLGETSAYPGNWLYASWSESDLKAWCDERGIPVPQPSSRDKLIATVRRNSRVASNNFASYTSAAAASAASATQSLSDALFNSYSDSELKAWADKNGIKVPQGSKRNELIALARKHQANLGSSASSFYGAATSSAGNQYAQATSAVGDGQNVVYSYFDWLKSQVGLAGSTASASGSSASSVASASASSASSVASSSASSASSVAASSASSAYSSLSSAASSASSSASKKASKSGSKEAKKAGDAAAESVSKGKHRVQEAYQKATDYAKEEL